MHSSLATITSSCARKVSTLVQFFFFFGVCVCVCKSCASFNFSHFFPTKFSSFSGVKIWDLASGRLRLTLTGHIDQVRGSSVIYNEISFKYFFLYNLVVITIGNILSCRFGCQQQAHVHVFCW